jgi:hypothetical protein
MRYLFSIVLLLSFKFSISQKIVKGVVLEQSTNQPIPRASIFLSNTSIGTTANQQGAFELTVPAGKFDFIVSSVGFETYNQTINAADINEPITIKLQPKVKDLETVIVEPFVKDGWEQWGRFFLENFVGTSDNAKDCKIKNTHVIKFRHSKKNNELSAYAMEPLVIENKALGYTIRYQLEGFTYNFKLHRLYYEGYPFFQPMAGNAARQRRWARQRSEAYMGSNMHFMRSVFRNTIIEEGFTVQHLKKQPNIEKQRIKELYARGRQTMHIGNKTTIIMGREVQSQKDSAEYYDKILRQADYFDLLNPTQLTGDSIAYAVNTTTAGMTFNDYLLIVYKHALAPSAYQKANVNNGTAMASQITLLNGEPIEILATGAYYNPAELLTVGYWAWSEKMATMLPFDYKVTTK